MIVRKNRQIIGRNVNIKIKYLLTVIILFTSVIIGQDQDSPKKTNIGTKDSFFQDILNFKSDKIL